MIIRKDITFLCDAIEEGPPALPKISNLWRWLCDGHGAIWYRNNTTPQWRADAYAFVNEETGDIAQRPSRPRSMENGSKYDPFRPIGTQPYDEVVNI